MIIGLFDKPIHWPTVSYCTVSYLLVHTCMYVCDKLCVLSKLSIFQSVNCISSRKSVFEGTVCITRCCYIPVLKKISVLV